MAQTGTSNEELWAVGEQMRAAELSAAALLIWAGDDVIDIDGQVDRLAFPMMHSLEPVRMYCTCSLDAACTDHSASCDCVDC